MKAVRITALLLAAAVTTGLYFVIPNHFLLIGIMVWAASWLAEEKPDLKSALILLYMPFTMLVFPVLFIIAAGFIMAFIGMPDGLETESSVVALAVTLLLLSVFFDFIMFDLLCILRHRKKENLAAPVFVILTALAVVIRIALILTAYFYMQTYPGFNEDYQTAMLSIMATPQANALLIGLFLTVYLPPLGVILAPPAEETEGW